MIKISQQGRIRLIGIDRPACRNAVDGPTAHALHDAFVIFDTDDSVDVAILYGTGNHFCAGADLKAIATDPARRNPLSPDGVGPMGPTRLQLSKPVLAAIEGHAVAGGLELALWCDLRVAASDAVLGVFCRRFGVPLIDGGSVRLPRLIGMSRALDLVLTGRPVPASEALDMGLINRMTAPGQALATTLALAQELAAFPQTCLRNDRLSAYRQWDKPEVDAMREEFRLGMATLVSGETLAGATRFSDGTGRHGHFSSPAANEPEQ